MKATRFELLAALVLGLAVSACAAEAPKSSKDTLMYGVNAEAASLDPSTSKDTVTHMMMLQIYDTLVAVDPQDYTKYVPGLATEWKFSDDKMELVFTIRDGVKFHNGDTMTADDVLFSLNRSFASSYSSGIRGAIKGFEKIDDRHVKLLLKYPYAPILEVMSNLTFGIVSQRAVKEAEAKGVNFARNPCGTGAYRMKEWKSGDQLELERFDGYYRGPAPINWCILNGETQTGVTTMLTDAGVDTGDILLCRQTPIGAEETAGELSQRLSHLGAQVLLETLEGYLRGQIRPRKQDAALASRQPMLKKEMAQIDWQMSAQAIVNRVRGFNPWPCAWTRWDGGVLKIYRARACEGAGEPGEAIRSSAREGLVVACGEGAVEILEMQAPNARRMAATAYLAGKRIEPGTKFGGG